MATGPASRNQQNEPVRSLVLGDITNRSQASSTQATSSIWSGGLTRFDPMFHSPLFKNTPDSGIMDSTMSSNRESVPPTTEIDIVSLTNALRLD